MHGIVHVESLWRENDKRSLVLYRLNTYGRGQGRNFSPVPCEVHEPAYMGDSYGLASQFLVATRDDSAIIWLPGQNQGAHHFRQH